MFKQSCFVFFFGGGLFFNEEFTFSVAYRLYKPFYRLVSLFLKYKYHFTVMILFVCAKRVFSAFLSFGGKVTSFFNVLKLSISRLVSHECYMLLLV